jgi:hypothetical protein
MNTHIYNKNSDAVYFYYGFGGITIAVGILFLIAPLLFPIAFVLFGFLLILGGLASLIEGIFLRIRSYR